METEAAPDASRPDTARDATSRQDAEAARRAGYLRGWLIILAVLWIASLVGVWMLSARRAAPALSTVSGALDDQSERLDAQDAELKDLRQQVATLRRSDQISRNANIELQSTLAEREEEVSGLRADVDFYERLVGSTGQRQGLRVHEASFEREAAGTWHYTVTLTQNLNRGAISRGQMRFAVDGVRGGKLATIKWDELLQTPNAPGKPFSFRYFQQLEDSVMLPPGITPQRVRVSLTGSGSPVDQTFAWSAPKPPGA
jgi:cell division protein FtsL